MGGNLSGNGEKLFDLIMDSYVFYHGDCSCDHFNKCKHCEFCHELYEKLKPNDNYIKQLEAQIARDRESLVSHNKHQVLAALVEKAKRNNQR